VTESAIIILYLGTAAFVASYLQVTFFTLTAQRQALRIRRLYFTALVRQEMAWFDQQATGALSSRISSDIPKIQDAIGDKVASFLQFTGMFIAGFAVGFAYGWQLTLVILAITPIMGLGGALMSKMLSEAASGGQGFYASAGSIADEVLHMIRTVVAFDTQEKVCRT
jgi:ABC-type multidrug transport system fused ATPase/permease subunit